MSKTTVVGWRLTRNSAMNTDPTKAIQRAIGFAKSIGSRNNVTLLVHRTDGELRYHALAASTSANDAVKSLAHMVGARMDIIETMPDLTQTGAVAALEVDARDPGGRFTQAGADLSEFSRIAADSLAEDQWLAASVRVPTRIERQRQRRWLAHRMGNNRPTHHSEGMQPVAVSFYAGAETIDQARAVVSLATQLPGFDMRTRAVRVSSGGPAALCALAGVAAAGLGVLWNKVIAPQVPTIFTNIGAVPQVPTALLAVMVGVGIVLGLGVKFGLLPSRGKRVRRALESGFMPAPRTRLLPPAKPRQEKHGTDAEGNPTHTAESPGDYPLAQDVFVMGPELVGSMVAPQAGAASGSSTSKERSIPSAVTRPIGPLFATVPGLGTPLYLSAESLHYGVCAYGKAGSGKTEAFYNMAAWAMAERTHPSGRAGYPGSQTSMIMFETKLDGLATLESWAGVVGDQVGVIDIADPTSLSIDFFDTPGSVVDKARRFADAAMVALGENKVGPESLSSITQVIAGGLVVTPAMAAAAGVEVGRSPVYYAFILLGRYGADEAMALWAQIEDQANTYASGSFDESERNRLHQCALAAKTLAPMYGPTITNSQRGALWKAPGNKLDKLVTVDHFFAPGRNRVTWASILTKYRAAVVMVGASRSGATMTQDLQETMGPMLLHMLQQQIIANCAGWQRQGKSVMVFSDEVTHLANTSPKAVDWFRNEGRSYGVCPFFATQYPERLNPDVRAALDSFDTLLAFQPTDQSSEYIGKRLSASDTTAVSQAELLAMPRYQAYVLTHVDGVRQEPFLVQSHRWLTEGPQEWLSQQGYQVTA